MAFNKPFAGGVDQAGYQQQIGTGAGLWLPPGMWTVTVGPATGTIASVSKAAVANVMHVCWAIVGSFTCGANNDGSRILLRDGAPGIGGILMNHILQALANQNDTMRVTPLNIPGTVGNAMSLEFVNCGVTSAETLMLVGYDVII